MEVGTIIMLIFIAALFAFGGFLLAKNLKAGNKEDKIEQNKKAE